MNLDSFTVLFYWHNCGRCFLRVLFWRPLFTLISMPYYIYFHKCKYYIQTSIFIDFSQLTCKLFRFAFFSFFLLVFLLVFSYHLFSTVSFLFFSWFFYFLLVFLHCYRCAFKYSYCLFAAKFGVTFNLSSALFLPLQQHVFFFPFCPFSSSLSAFFASVLCLVYLRAKHTQQANKPSNISLLKPCDFSDR